MEQLVCVRPDARNVDTLEAVWNVSLMPLYATTGSTGSRMAKDASVPMGASYAACLATVTSASTVFPICTTTMELVRQIAPRPRFQCAQRLVADVWTHSFAITGSKKHQLGLDVAVQKPPKQAAAGADMILRASPVLNRVLLYDRDLHIIFIICHPNPCETMYQKPLPARHWPSCNTKSVVPLATSCLGA